MSLMSYPKAHSQIIPLLTPLKNEELVTIGLILGLRYPRLKKMSSDCLLNDMVHAWLRRDDDVIEGSGEPTLESLINALQACGHTGVVADIRKQGILCVAKRVILPPFLLT